MEERTAETARMNTREKERYELQLLHERPTGPFFPPVCRSSVHPDWLSSGMALTFPGKFLERQPCGQFHENRRFRPRTSITNIRKQLPTIKLPNESLQAHSSASSLLTRPPYARLRERRGHRFCGFRGGALPMSSQALNTGRFSEKQSREVRQTEQGKPCSAQPVVQF